MERQDFDAPVESPLELKLSLTAAEEAVGASISLPLPRSAVGAAAHGGRTPTAEFFNVAVAPLRRTLVAAPAAAAAAHPRSLAAATRRSP